MKNSITLFFSILGSVWCGIAFLRSLVEILIQARDSMCECVLSAMSERRRFDSSTPHRFVEVYSDSITVRATLALARIGNLTLIIPQLTKVTYG